MNRVLEKLQNLLIYAIPVFLILGLIDYRFNNYYWSRIDSFRLIQFQNFFDFFSVFTFFALIFVVFYFVVFVFCKKRRPDFRFRWSYLTIIWLFAGSALAYVFFEPIEPYIKSVEAQLLINYIVPLAVAIILLFSIKEKKIRKVFELMLLLGFSILATLTIFEFFTGILPGDSQDFLGRAVWPYIDPFVGMKAESANWLAYLYGPMALLGIMQFHEDGMGYKVVAFTAFILNFGALLLTKSYTGILVVLFLISVYLLIVLPKVWRKWLITGFLLMLAIGVATQYKSDKFQILIGNYDKPNSVERRLQIYDLSYKALTENFVVGIGPGAYQSYFRANQAELIDEIIPEQELPPHPHNLILNFWSDLGVLGLLAIISLYILCIAKLFGGKKNLYYLLLAYPLLHGLVDTPYGLEEVSMMFWILLVLAVTHSEHYKEELAQEV